jgi:hypothetical protein
VFGLPAVPAEEYADVLFPEEEGNPIVLSLKKSVNVCRDQGPARVP